MFFMNGRLFDPDRIDDRARLDDLEHWQVDNVGTMDHPFHLHTWHFQVIARNGRPEPFRAWRDMVNLKPGDRVDLMVPLVRLSGPDPVPLPHRRARRQRHDGRARGAPGLTAAC